MGCMANAQAIRALVQGLLEWQDPNIFNLSEPLNEVLIKIGRDTIPHLLEFMKTAPPNSQLRAIEILSMIDGGVEGIRPYVNATDATVGKLAIKIIEQQDKWPE